MNRYGKGVWGDAICYHDKKFWIYFGTPEEGYFMNSSKDIDGPWKPLHAVLTEKGCDDCCLFWNDNGKAYLIGTKFSDEYKMYFFKLTTGGKDIIKNADKIIYQSKGSEAIKLYRFEGLYYHFF